MKNERSLEIGTGLFVLLGFAALAFLTTQLPGSRLSVLGDQSGYGVTARFENVGDLQPGIIAGRRSRRGRERHHPWRELRSGPRHADRDVGTG